MHETLYKKNLDIAYIYDHPNNYLFRLAKHNDFAQTIREGGLFKQLQMTHYDGAGRKA